MRYFIEIACVVVELWCMHLLSGRREYSVPMQMALLMYVLIGVVISVMSFIDGIAFLRLLVSAGLIWLLGVFVYELNIIRGLLYTLAYCAMIILSEILVLALLAVCGIDTGALMTTGPSRLLYMIFSHTIMLGISVALSLFQRRDEKIITVKSLLLISPCWLISILLGILLAWQVLALKLELHPLYLVVLLGLLYINIIVIYYTDRLNAQAQKQKEYELAEHHYAMQQRYYEQQNLQQEEIRSIWHDIKKYIRAEQAEEKGSAMMELQDRLSAISCAVDVGNRVVNVILNEYLQTAKSAETELLFDIHIPDELFVTAADLYILLGNTIENALEACAELPVEKRKIQVSLKILNQMLFYKISNPFLPEHLERPRGRQHGYGLKNVKRCVEKHSGTMEITSENGSFCLSARLNDI